MVNLREWAARHRATFARTAHMLEYMTLLVLLLGGGGGAGYALCQWQSREQLAQQRDDHQAEIARLQEAYTRTLNALAPKVQEAAGSAAKAAEASVEAAKSAKQATRSGQAAVSTAPRPLTEAERQGVNRDIEAANEKVRGVRK